LKKDFEHTIALFHNRARQILLSHYCEFKHSIAPIDRRGDENVFQLQYHKYADRLKYQLHCVASETLQGIPAGTDTTKMNQALSHLIEAYLQEFTQKVRSL
jgi:hypothetical protein